MTSSAWYIRRTDGKPLEFADLNALRGAIDAGLVDITDEVSRDGTSWSPLMSIAEFQSLFQHRSNPSSVPVVEAFSQASKPFEEPDFEAGLTHLTGQMATQRGKRPTQFQNRNMTKTILLSLCALLMGIGVAWGIQSFLEGQERDAAAFLLLQEAETLSEQGSPDSLDKALKVLGKLKALERVSYRSKTLEGLIHLDMAKHLDRTREEGRRALSLEGVGGDAERLQRESQLAMLSRDIETRLATSLATLNEVIEFDSEQVEARIGLATLAMFRGQRAEAEAHLEPLRRAQVQDTQLIHIEAWLKAEKEPVNALKVLRPVVTPTYSDTEAQQLLARLFISTEDFEGFDAWLEAQRSKTVVASWILDDLATFAARAREEALAKVEAAAPPTEPQQVFEETDAALLKRAALLRRRDKPKSASRIYRRVIERNAKPPVRALVGLGWCLFDLDLPYEAKTEFTKAIKLSPNTPDAHLGLAEVLRSIDDPQALTHFEIYLTLRPRAQDADYVRRVVEQLK